MKSSKSNAKIPVAIKIFSLRHPRCDLSAISAEDEQEKRGYPPYHPRMMVALLLYAYCRGIVSSRRIMQACQERISFRVLVGHDIPNFRTISEIPGQIVPASARTMVFP